MNDLPVIYLAPASQPGSIDLPIPQKDEQPFPKFNPVRNLFGLSTHKVCPAPDVTIRTVGSYPTISPLSTAADGIFSVALSVIKPSPV
jgi:hypothetical protein